MGRRERNDASKQLDDLELRVKQLKLIFRGVQLRAVEDADFRRDPPRRKGDNEPWATCISYNDETGETAVRDREGETVEGYVRAMEEHVSKGLTIALQELDYALDRAQVVLEIAPRDAVERAKRTVPDCLACGKPVSGRIISGYDDSCYKAWQRAGRPDRHQFERQRKQSVDLHVPEMSTDKQDV